MGVFSGIVKIFSSIFNMVTRYDGLKSTYLRSGFIGRLLLFVLQAAMVALSCFLTYGAIWLIMQTSFESFLHFFAWFGGIVVAGIALYSAVYSIESLILYTIVCFASAVRPVTIKDQIADKVKEEIKKSTEQPENQTVVADVANTEQTAENTEQTQNIEEAQNTEQQTEANNQPITENAENTTKENQATAEKQASAEHVETLVVIENEKANAKADKIVDKQQKSVKHSKFFRVFDIIMGVLHIVLLGVLIAGEIMMFKLWL